VVPFSAFFPAGKADPTLIDRLTSQRELQGLLRAAVGGLQQVMRRGSFTMPASVTDATHRFKMEADPMRGFIEERIEFVNDERTFTPRTDVYTGYTSWAVINGFHQMSAQRFYESFVAAAVDTTQYPLRVSTLHGAQGYRGLRLR
jgi:putative DNA primase/helicase